MQSVGVSLYFDKDMNVFINPILRNTSGVGIGANQVIELKKGYNEENLAESILEALEISHRNDIDNQGEPDFWKELIGKKGFAAFSKKHKSVSIGYLRTQDHYYVTADKRYKDGSYGTDADNIALRQKEYPGRPTKETIAGQVLEALKIVIKEDYGLTDGKI